MLFRFDAWLIRQLEKFTHWFQKLTGKDNFFLARCALAVSVVCILVRAIDPVTGNLRYQQLFSGGVFGLLYLYNTSTEEETIREDAIKGFANRNKVSSFVRFLRLLWFSIMIIVTLPQCFLFALFLFGDIPFGIIDWRRVLDESSFALFWYLIACDPLPPCSSKVMDWLRSFGQKPVPVEAE